jgi:hypothetical protein
VTKDDLNNQGRDDIRLENGEIFVQMNGEALESKNFVATSGRENRDVTGSIQTNPQSPISSTESPSAEFRSLRSFEITQNTSEVGSYRIVRNYVVFGDDSSDEIPFRISKRVKLHSGDRIFLAELSYTNTGNRTVKLDQDTVDIHDGFMILINSNLSERTDRQGDYRFYLPGQGTSLFSNQSKFETFSGTNWATVFDAQDAVTYGLVDGHTSPKMWVATNGLDYELNEFHLDPGQSVSYTTFVGIHAGGSEAPDVGQQIYETAKDRAAGETPPDDGKPANRSPTADFTYSPQEPSVGEEVTLDASGSGDPDGTITKYEWDFDNDGTYEKSGQQVTVSFETVEDQLVNLRVTDSKGATQIKKAKISIGASPLRNLQQQKLKRATRVDDFSVTTLFDDGERRRVEPLLETLITDTEQGKIDEEAADEAITRMEMAERITEETLAAVGTEDQGPSDEVPHFERVSLGSDTVSFALDFSIELLFLGASIKLKSGANLSFGDEFSADAAVDSINSVTSNLLDWAYPRIEKAADIEYELRSNSETVVQKVDDGSISSAEQAQEELAATVEETLSTALHPLQSRMEQTTDGGIEAGLNEVNTTLEPSSIQRSNGLQGDHDGALQSSDEGIQRLRDVAFKADEFLDRLEKQLDKLDIIKLAFQLAEADNSFEVYVASGSIVGVILMGPGILFWNAVGMKGGEFAITSLRYNHYYSVKGIAEGQPPTEKSVGQAERPRVSPQATIPKKSGSKFYDIDPIEFVWPNDNRTARTMLRQFNQNQSSTVEAIEKFKQAVSDGDQKQARELFIQIRNEYGNRRMAEQQRFRQALAVQQTMKSKANHRMDAHGYVQQLIATEINRLSLILYTPVYLEDSTEYRRKQLVTITDQLLTQENALSKRTKTLKKASGSVAVPPSISVTATDVSTPITQFDGSAKMSIAIMNSGDSVAKDVEIKGVSDAGIAISPRTASIGEIEPDSKARHNFKVTGGKNGTHLVSFRATSSNTEVASETVRLSVNNRATPGSSSDTEVPEVPDWAPYAGGAGAGLLGLGAGAHRYLRRNDDEQGGAE